MRNFYYKLVPCAGELGLQTPFTDQQEIALRKAIVNQPEQVLANVNWETWHKFGEDFRKVGFIVVPMRVTMV